MSTAATTCGLSLESYLQIHRALTKNSGIVQSVTPIEECYYKLQDLKQLLSLHGIASSKFSRFDVLQGMKGKALINPICISQQRSSTEEPNNVQQATGMQSSKDSKPGGADSSASALLFSAADLASLGWADDGGDVLLCSLEQLQLGVASGSAAEEAMLQELGPTHPPAASNPQPALRHAAEAVQQVQTAAALQLPTHACGVGSAPITAAADVKTSGCKLPIAAVSTSAVAVTEAVVGLCSSHMATLAGIRAETLPDQAPTAALQVQAPIQVAKLADAAAIAAVATSSVQTAARDVVMKCINPVQLQPTVTNIGTVEPESESAAFYSEQQQQQHQTQKQPEPKKLPQQTAVQQLCSKHGAAEADHALVSNPMEARLHSAGLQVGCRLPGHSHAQWLLQQLQLFVMAGAAASNERLPNSSSTVATAPSSGLLGGGQAGAAGVLLGRGVGFALMEQMQVAGPKNTQLTLPAGVYEGRVVKYLGSSCQPELCEPTCLGNHQFYRARIIAPQLPGQDEGGLPADAVTHEQAAVICQAHAAASGRPVLLILDLHSRLRCNTFKAMLQLSASKLQDAWVLLEPPTPDQDESNTEVGKRAAMAALPSTTQSRKGRPSKNSQQPPQKRAKA